MTGAKLIVLNSLVASLASGSANFMNTFCMRKVEMNNGIEIFSDEQLSQKVGTSQLAAKKAIIETASSRVFLSFACLMTPALIFYAFERAGRTPVGARAKMLYEVGVFTFSLMLALPASIALFPQTGKLQRGQIPESDIQAKELQFTHIYYNKGL